MEIVIVRAGMNSWRGQLVAALIAGAAAGVGQEILKRIFRSPAIPRKIGPSVFLLNPSGALVCGGAVAAVLMLTGYPMGTMPVVYLSIWSFWELRSTAGQFRPEGAIPTILILRPFRSVRRDELFQNWLAPALWQVGQPIIPVDPASTRPVTRGAPSLPSYHRHLFCFYQVLDNENWRSDVRQAMRSAHAILIDTSVYRDFVMDELSLIASEQSLIERTIPIHEDNLLLPAAERRDRYFESPNAKILELVKGSWPYYSASETSLESLWHHVISRAAAMIHVDRARVCFLDAPNKWWLNAARIVQHLTFVRALDNVGLPLSGIRFRKATQGDWVEAKLALQRIGAGHLASISDAVRNQIIELILGPHDQFYEAARTKSLDVPSIVLMIAGFSSSKLARILGTGLLTHGRIERWMKSIESGYGPGAADFLIAAYLAFFENIEDARNRLACLQDSRRREVEESFIPSLGNKNSLPPDLPGGGINRADITE